MSYPWTDRHSFVADWSKQGEGEDSSQQGLAALLGLVTNSTAVLFLATPAAGLPVSLLPHCCHCAVTPLLPGWATGCSEGAGVLQQSTGQRMLGSGCQRDPTPQQGTCKFSQTARWPPAACLHPGTRCQPRVGPSQRMWLQRGSLLTP